MRAKLTYLDDGIELIVDVPDDWLLSPHVYFCPIRGVMWARLTALDEKELEWDTWTIIYMPAFGETPRDTGTFRFPGSIIPYGAHEDITGLPMAALEREFLAHAAYVAYYKGFP